jgi:23S rRNA (adenine2503-C2)-methyltransferase
MRKELLLDKDVAEMNEFVHAFDEPAYRTRQLLDWIYKKHAISFEEISNVPKKWRSVLQESVFLTPFKSFSIQLSADGTRKYLFELHDGASIESVCIPMKDHFTLCISTQVGCVLNCEFCLTGRQGFSRNLSSGEILGQILTVQRELPSKKRISNIVLMGMGEPLLNYEQTKKAIRMMLSQEGLNFSNRKITISTAGILPGIERLGQEDFTINLAISLNAPTDELRSELMPINKTYPLHQLLQVCRTYPLPERRRITFEYILLDTINDSPDHAAILADSLRGIRCKINLIPLNVTPGSPYTPSPEGRMLTFQDILLRRGYSTFIRASKGADILAACGQLSGQSKIDRQRKQL